MKYQQASRLQGVRYDVRGPNMVEAQRMERAGERILKLNIGNLAPFGFRTPETMVKAMVSHLAEAEGYSDARGLFSARTAVANHYQTAAGMHVDVDQIFLGNGVSELISILLQCIVDPGDEILIPSPDYPLWTAQTILTGGNAVHYLCDESNGWNPDLTDIKSKITNRTKAIVIINPNNPTGAVYSEEVLRGIIDLARRHGIIVFSDEIYEKIVYHGEHHYAARLCGEDVLCFTFSGLSKSYRACGYRTGWVVATGPLERAHSIMEGISLLANMRMCSNVPGQFTIQMALGGIQTIDDLVRPGGRFYDQMDLSYRLLKEIPGIECQPARGSLYLFPKLDPEMYPIENDENWTYELLRRKKILVSHGTSFNWAQPDHFRLVALPESEVLTEAIGRIGEFCAETVGETF